MHSFERPKPVAAMRYGIDKVIATDLLGKGDLVCLHIDKEAKSGGAAIERRLRLLRESRESGPINIQRSSIIIDCCSLMSVEKLRRR